MINALTEMPEILPGKEGLVHISQLAVERIENVDDLLKLGDMIEVKLIHVDDAGKMSLSRKALLPGGENAHEEMARSRERRSSGGGDRGRGGRGGRPNRR
jgi:polyribonucleotide nucleotidyltransferase